MQTVTEPELTDDEVRAIAARMYTAMRRPLVGDQPADILDRRHELSALDEARVAAALARLRTQAASADSGPESGPESAEGATHRPAGSDHTVAGEPTKATQGYGTAQGASGATPGGADPGGSTSSPPG
jgi:hypothetical protein